MQNDIVPNKSDACVGFLDRRNHGNDFSIVGKRGLIRRELELVRYGNHEAPNAFRAGAIRRKHAGRQSGIGDTALEVVQNA